MHQSAPTNAPADDVDDVEGHYEHFMRRLEREAAHTQPPATRVDIAAAWLRHALRLGSLPARTVCQSADRAGIELGDLLAAKRRLGVVEQRIRCDPDGDVWALPGQELPTQADRPPSKKARQRARRRLAAAYRADHRTPTDNNGQEGNRQ